MSGPSLPTVWRAPAARIPDAVLGPIASSSRFESSRRPEPAPRAVVDPYGRGRTVPAGLLVDLYG